MVFLRDVAHVRDGYPPQTNIVRVNGQRASLLTILKTGAASTLDIIQRVRETLELTKDSLPPNLKIEPIADQSLFVRASIDGVIKDLKKDPKAPDKLKVKSAVAEGQTVTWEVAKTMPTRLEAIGDVVAALLGAGAAIAGCLTGPASQLASILTTIEEKGKGGEPPAAA